MMNACEVAARLALDLEDVEAAPRRLAPKAARLSHHGTDLRVAEPLLTSTSSCGGCPKRA